MKRTKIISIALLSLLVIGVASAIGYNLFTATSHFEVEEGIEIGYWTGTDWASLDVSSGTFDLGTSTINPGETDSFILRGRNIASSGAIDLTLEIGDVDGLSHSVECVAIGDVDSIGLEYEGAANTYHFKVVGGNDWKSIKVNTIAEGNLPIGAITFNNTITRDNVLSSYGNVCP